ncbi:MAG: substrate-binding domain-containing protein [Beutenbergiaceae bacterium]
MRKSRAFTAALGTIALAVTLAACADSTDTGGGSDGADGSDAAAGDGVHVGVIMLQGDTYYQGIQSGLEAAVEADGGEVTTGLSNNDPATENTVAQNMIQAGVDAILMQPTADEASIATMQSIKDAGIALICYGNCVGPTTDPELVDGVIQSDNTALGIGTGELAAEYINSELGGSVNLVILNCDIASACKLRKSGFLDTLEAEGITVNILTDQEALLVDRATPITTDILTANDDIDMIWASNEGGTAGAVIAVQQSGRDIPVFGTDISSQLAEFVISDDGVLQATTGQDPVGTAEGAYEMALVILDGGQNEPHAVELPGIVYDRNNPATTDEFLAAQ